MLSLSLIHIYGIAGQVKKLFPEVEKTYKRITKQWIEKENGDTSKLLGRVSAQPVEKDGRWFLIGNLYGQDDYGRKKMVYTDYDALEKACLLYTSSRAMRRC